MRLRNGPNSDPITGRIEVRGRIAGTDKGYRDFHVRNETLTIRFRGTITGFEFDGQGSIDIDGQSFRARDVAGYDTRTGSSGDDSSSGSAPADDTNTADPRPDHRPTGQSGASFDGNTPLGERVELAAGRDRPGDVRVFKPHQARDFDQYVKDCPPFMQEAMRIALADGTYDVGVLDGTVSSNGGAPLLRITGNVENPYSVSIDGPTNIAKLVKDEHLHLEGFECSYRSQLWGIGQVLCQNMVFSDRRRQSHSSLGGKPVAARLQDCHLGHKDDPDRRAAYLYGTGELYLKSGNTIRATGDSYIEVTTTTTTFIGGNNEFASGRKEVIGGSGVYPDDLHNGQNIFMGTTKIA